jgi:hypothetical protein
MNYKPNYISVMNYLFQLDVYETGRALDFSVGNHNTLNESSLNEANGIGEAVITAWSLPDGRIAKSNGNLVIDWNFDGTITANVGVNLNNFPQEPSSWKDPLTDYNDWANLLFSFRGTVAFAPGAHEEDQHQELTLEEIEAMREDAKTIIEVVSPEHSEQPQDLPIEILYVIGVVMIGVIVFVVYMIMIRKKKK